MAIQAKKDRRHKGRLNLRVPPALPIAIEQAAGNRFLSVSEYIRHALVRQLDADGIKIKSAAQAAA